MVAFHNVTGKELKARRTKLGLTQTELGNRIGVARNTITRWEMGIRRIPKPVVQLLEFLRKEVRAERKKKRKRV